MLKNIIIALLALSSIGTSLADPSASGQQALSSEKPRTPNALDAPSQDSAKAAEPTNTKRCFTDTELDKWLAKAPTSQQDQDKKQQETHKKVQHLVKQLRTIDELNTKADIIPLVKLIMTDIDINQDGYLSGDEFDLQAPYIIRYIAENFASSEYADSTTPDAMKHFVYEVGISIYPLDIKFMGDSLFDKSDQNNSGTLEQAEMQVFKQHFYPQTTDKLTCSNSLAALLGDTK